MIKNKQTARLFEYLKKGHIIDRLDAFTVLGIFELSSRLCELQKQGIEIESIYGSVINRYDEVIRVKKYWLKNPTGDLNNE